jgi:hypothetical protein
LSLKSLIQNLANNAIAVNIGDLKSTVVLRSVQGGAYDPATGQLTRTVTDYTCVGLLTNLSQTDVMNQAVDVTARKLLIPTRQLPGVNADALDDLAVIDGVEWTIVGVQQDPAQALFKFIVKSRQGVQVGGS